MVVGETAIEAQVAVIGAGPGGYAAAFRAADLGLDVTLIDPQERPGGVCLFRGCIPSKALLEATELIADSRRASDWGIRFKEPQVDLERLCQWKDEVVDRLTKGLLTLSKRREVQLVHGRATFEDSQHLRLTGSDVDRVQFEHAILTTGSRPIALPGTAFQAESRIMDSRAALDLPDIPERLLVVGGGYIGLELGSVYARLGSQVTVIEMLDSLLPRADADLVRYLSREVKELFHAIHLGTKVTDLSEKEDEVAVTLEGDVDEPEQSFDRVLVAIGRRPNSEGIGLENTEVELDDDGFVRVDEQRRTHDEHIFAVGDIAGGLLLAHKAMHEGKVAAEAIAGHPAAYDVRCVPAVVYTDPQVAWCGLMEAEADEQGRSVRILTFPWGASGRAVTMGAPTGLTKLVCAADTGRVLGVGIVGRGAENLIAEGVLAIEMGALAEDLALTIHPHPTLSETISEAAEAFARSPTHTLARQG
jgi:dihydrolipoamide dehydrogenase